MRSCRFLLPMQIDDTYSHCNKTPKLSYDTKALTDFSEIILHAFNIFKAMIHSYIKIAVI